MDFGVTKEQTLLVERVGRMVKENIALERFYRDMHLHMLHDATSRRGSSERPSWASPST